MKKHFNNKGSTLVLLIMAIAVISLLGTSILGVTMMNLKIKKANTELKQTFYLSESGLDKAHAMAYELVQDAVKFGNEEAKNFIDSFKPENIEALKADPVASLCLDSVDEVIDGVLYTSYLFNEQKIKDNAEVIFKDFYTEYITKTDYYNIHNNIFSKVEGVSNSKLTVDITNDTPPPVFIGDELLLIINSKYINDSNIQKTTSVNMIVKVPEYNEPYTVLTKLIPINPFWTKALTAKNLTVNGASEFNGNVYLSENLLVNGASINPLFNGKLAVKGDMQLNGDNSITNVKDVYAHNIFLNGDRAKLTANCSTGAVESGAGIFVKDDLEINKDGQEVNIDGTYYGFYDGRSNPGPDKSSGININTFVTDNIKLNVTRDVYLYGTSYVKINDSLKYQTGESISILGNYRAYTEPLHSSTHTKDLTEGNINFVDYDYLRLADSFNDTGEKLNVFDKAYYLFNYNDEYRGYLMNFPSNIKVDGSIKSIGCATDNGNLTSPSYIIDDTDVFNKSENAYNTEILKLGDKTVTSGELQFSNEVKLSELSTNKSESTTTGTVTEIVYLNKDGGTYNLPAGNYTGLIVTNGDVNITGNVTFKGSIICGGDITINGTGSVFTYDKSVVAAIIAKYEELYKKVFKPDTSGLDPIGITYFETVAASGDSTNVNFNKLLKFNEWKIK